jgi:hypothetical protein
VEFTVIDLRTIYGFTITFAGLLQAVYFLSTKAFPQFFSLWFISGQVSLSSFWDVATRFPFFRILDTLMHAFLRGKLVS